MVDAYILHKQQINDLNSVASAGSRVFAIARKLKFTAIDCTVLGVLTRNLLLELYESGENLAHLTISLIRRAGGVRLSIQSNAGNISPERLNLGTVHIAKRVEISIEKQNISIEGRLPDPDFVPSDDWITQVQSELFKPRDNELRAELLKKNKDLNALLSDLSDEKNKANEKNDALEKANKLLDELREREYNLARFDRVTGLASRTLFDEKLSSAIAASAPFALLFLDLDRFKEINDSLGHAAGDEVLRIVGERMYDSVRGDDIVARLGGDEFGIIIPRTSSQEEITHLANRLIAQVSAPITVGSHNCSVGVSIGITLNTDEQRSLKELMQHADTAMYQAKQAGRGRFQFYSSDKSA